MVMDGKKIRIKRIADKKTERFVIVPMDHGVSSGPIDGIIDIEDSINKVTEGGATAVLVHKGIVRLGLQKFGGEVGLILHLSASTSLDPDPNAKVLVTTVEEAMKLGSDAVSVHINVGADTDKEMIRDLGATARKCSEWQIPLLAMMYPRGPEIKDPFDVELVKHAARLGVELGADIIKTNYTGSIETFKEVIKGCSVPVIIAGGPKINSDHEVLQMVHDAMMAGAAGVSIGRNVFQHANVTGITRAISKIVINDFDVSEASREIIG